MQTRLIIKYIYLYVSGVIEGYDVINTEKSIYVLLKWHIER